MKQALPCLTVTLLLACSGAPQVFGQSPTARTVAELLTAPEPGRTAQLDGRIAGKKNAATWIFQDATGILLVDMDEDVEKGVTREMKKGAAMRVAGVLFRPLGSQQWELRATDVRRLKGDLPTFAAPTQRPAANVQSRISTVQTTPAPPSHSGRKPFVLPRLFGRAGKPDGKSTAATSQVQPSASRFMPAATAVPVKAAGQTIADVLRSPNVGSVALSGTVMEVMSPNKILLWDGTAAMAVRLDRLGRVPELTRAQRVSVRGTLVREGAALVELQATEIR